MAQAERRSITRRQVVAASVIPVGGAFHVAAAADPMLAAIDRHARAYADVVALLAAQDAADRALQGSDAAARPRLQARLDALCEAEGPLGRVEMEATDCLIHTVPATLAGAAAALRYVRELFARGGYPLCEEDGYRALLLSTECAICREIGLPAPPPA